MLWIQCYSMLLINPGATEFTYVSLCTKKCKERHDCAQRYYYVKAQGILNYNTVIKTNENSGGYTPCSNYKQWHMAQITET